MIALELQPVQRRSFHPRSHISRVLYIFAIGIRTIILFILIKFHLSFQIGITSNGGTVCINAIATFYIQRTDSTSHSSLQITGVNAVRRYLAHGERSIRRDTFHYREIGLFALCRNGFSVLLVCKADSNRRTVIPQHGAFHIVIAHT